MSILSTFASAIGFQWKSEGRKLLEESKKSREDLLENLQCAEQTITKLAERVPDRRLHPDDTCPGERRHNHLRGI